MSSYYSDEDEDYSHSPSPSQQNSQYSKPKKNKKSKKSKSSQRKNSATTKDTKNFLKDINNILDDKDATVLQNPKSTRMSMTINRNINSTGAAGGVVSNGTSISSNHNHNHKTSGPASGPARGTMRHSIANRNVPMSIPVKQPQKNDEYPSKQHLSSSNIQNKSRSSLRSKSRGSTNESDDESDEFDDNPSPQALAMRDRFRQERLQQQQQQQQQQQIPQQSSRQSQRQARGPGAGSQLPDTRRTIARDRLKSTVQSPTSRPSVLTQQNSKLPDKRFSIAASSAVPGRSESAQTGSSRMSMRQGRVTAVQSIKSKPMANPVDTRLSARDVYDSSSSDNESDYYDSSSDESDSSDDDDGSESEDFDINIGGEDSIMDESTMTVVDPKLEASKADPLIYDMLMLGDGGVGKTSLLDSFITDSFSKEYVSTRGINQHSTTLYMGERKMLDRGKLKKGHVHVKLNIWDIGGRLTKHSYIKNSYILNSIIVIVVYDVTSLESYISAIETIKHVRRIQHDQMVVLVGNKADNSTVAADDDDLDSDEDEDNIVVVQPPVTGLRRLSTFVTGHGSVATGQVQPAPASVRESENHEVDSDGEPKQVLREIAKREAALEALKLGALFFETSAKTGHNIYILFNEISKILVHKRRKLLFKIEAGIKRMQEENGEHSSDFESDSSSDESNVDASDDDVEEGKSVDVDEDGNLIRKKKKKKEKVEESSSDDDSVLSAMSDWSSEDDDDDDDYVDVYGWGGKKKTEKEDCTIM